MLTEEELSLNRRCLILISKFGFLPIRVNQSTRKLQALQAVGDFQRWYALAVVM